MRYLRLLLACVALPIGLLLILPAALVAIPIWLVSFIVRRGGDWSKPALLSFPEMFRFDAELGWRPVENLQGHYEVERDDIHSVITDSRGWPGRSSLEESEVVVFGDSFAFGLGVDVGSSFAEQADGLKIKPIGAPGYSMVQSLLLMRRYARFLRKKTVLWFVYLENDPADNLVPMLAGYRAPFVRRRPEDGRWEIATSHIRKESWDLTARSRPNLNILAHLCTPSPLSERIFSACRFLIGEAKSVCREGGARLVVLTIPNLHQLSPEGLAYLTSQDIEPERFDPSYPDRRLEEVCRETGVEFVASMPYLEAGDYKAWEKFHWTEKGHRKIARLISEIHKRPLSADSTSRQDSRSTQPNGVPLPTR